MQDESPQLENGYTRLANELLDALIGAGLTARQWAVVMAIIRKTYGFNKKADEIGLSQLSAMTGIDKAHLSRTVRELEAGRVIHREAGTHGHKLSINKHFKQWELLNQQLPKEQRLPKKQLGVAESATERVAESATLGLPKEQPQNTSLKNKGKTTSKDNLSRSLRERFDAFWSAYPKKKSKDAAEKALAKRKPDEQLFADIMSGLERAKTSVEWLDKQYIPYPASWLNDGGWMDEYTPTVYSASEIAVIDAYNAAMSEAWPRAVVDPFSAQRATAIREFVEFAPGRADMPEKYFAHCQANLAVDERCGFDWLIKRETYIRVKEDAVKHKEPA